MSLDLSLMEILCPRASSCKKTTVLLFVCGSGTTVFLLTAGFRSRYRTSWYNAKSLGAEHWTPWHCTVLKSPSSVLKSNIFSSSSGEWAIKNCYRSIFCSLQVIFGLWMQQSLKYIQCTHSATGHIFLHLSSTSLEDDSWFFAFASYSTWLLTDSQ